MPSKKQRRRQQKSRRHEYEYVYVDEEGNEVETDEAAPVRPAKTESKPKSRAGASSARRPGRVVRPPSWRRVAIRALIFAPLMFVFITILSRNGQELTIPQRLLQTALLLAVFLPFSYFTDSLAYRAYRRRVGDDGRS